jgi:hypothetical protein
VASRHFLLAGEHWEDVTSARISGEMGIGSLRLLEEAGEGETESLTLMGAAMCCTLSSSEEAAASSGLSEEAFPLTVVGENEVQLTREYGVAVTCTCGLTGPGGCVSEAVCELLDDVAPASRPWFCECVTGGGDVGFWGGGLWKGWVTDGDIDVVTVEEEVSAPGGFCRPGFGFKGGGLWKGEGEGDTDVVAVEEEDSTVDGSCRLGARLWVPQGDAAAKPFGVPATASHLSTTAAESDPLQ